LPTKLHDAFFESIRKLYAENMMLEVPTIPVDLDNLDGIRWRDRMRDEIARMKSGALDKMRPACQTAIEAAIAGLPKVAGDSEITSPLSSLVNPGQLIESLVKPLDAALFPNFADRYLDNVYRLSGIPRGKYAKPPKLVEPHQFDDPSSFLDRTPFAGILTTSIGTEIPNAVRNSHHWIVAGTDAGKTNALHYFIAKDLERASRGECSIVVMDSQHQLIDKLWNLKLFAPGQPLDGKLCLLNAADVEYPIALNLFDMKLDRTASLSLLERQKLTNSAFEMYDFLIGSLLGAEMTSRQSTVFRFITRALLAIPNATLATFQKILLHGPGEYQEYIATLDETTRQFFATEFNKTDTNRTKEQVNARLWAVLGNPTFLQMFSSPRSKIDFFAEINTPGKVILINAEKGLLKEEGTELFGRFFLALINQAAAQRSNMPPAQRLPCYVYVDECHNYIKSDQKIQVILAEARQQNIGVVLSHQFLGQLDAPVLRALAANTSIKMGALLEYPDDTAMARYMNTVPNFFRDLSIYSFAVFVRRVTPSAISMRFPFEALSRFETMNEAESNIVRQQNREMYSRRLEPDAPSQPNSNTSSESGSPDGRRGDPDAR
jgi:hypothetical protein